VGLRDFQEGKADIVYVYNSNETIKLKKLKEIPHDSGNSRNNFDDDIPVDDEEEEGEGFNFAEI
jgi:hypothetical protein